MRVQGLILFEIILSEPNEGINMYKNTSKVASRIAIAAALSAGITMGTVGIASASPVARQHGGHGWVHPHSRVEGVVSSYTAGSSISIVTKDSTTPTTYTLTSATVLNGLAAGVILASPDNVDLQLSTSTPVTVTSITLDVPHAVRIEGVVSAYVAGTSISILSDGSATPTTYALTSATTVTGLATGVALAAPAVVALQLSATTPVTVTSIKVETPQPARIEAVVSTYVAGTSITVLVKGNSTPITYVLTSDTTITGLATGVTLVSPAKVDLVLSTSIPKTVTSIFVEGSSNGKNCDHRDHSRNGWGNHRGDTRFHHSHGSGSARNGHGRR